MLTEPSNENIRRSSLLQSSGHDCKSTFISERILSIKADITAYDKDALDLVDSNASLSTLTSFVTESAARRAKIEGM